MQSSLFWQALWQILLSSVQTRLQPASSAWQALLQELPDWARMATLLSGASMGCTLWSGSRLELSASAPAKKLKQVKKHRIKRNLFIGHRVYFGITHQNFCAMYPNCSPGSEFCPKNLSCTPQPRTAYNFPNTIRNSNQRWTGLRNIHPTLFPYHCCSFLMLSLLLDICSKTS